MSNSENDIRLEQRSRDAASGYTPPGKASWEKMEAALDQVMPVQEKKRRRFLFWWLLPLLFIGAGAIYLSLPNNEISSTQKTKNISNSEPDTSPEQSQSVDNKKAETDLTNTEIAEQAPTTIKDEVLNTIPEPAYTKPATPNQNKVTFSQKNNAVNVSQTPVSKNSTDAQVITEDKKTNTASFDKKQTENPVTLESSTQSNKSELPQTNKTRSNDLNTIKITTDTGSNKNATGILEQKNDSSVQQSVVKTDTLNINNSIPKTNKSTDSKFSFALVGGMDASTVKFRYSSKAGINAGFITGYHFNETWSVHTGVLFTKKNYSMAGQDFHAPKGSWVANYKLTMVEGYCNMWEVPLLLRYKFNGTAKRGFFVSTGISSYFMTRENYNYSYYWNGQPITRNSNYPTGNTHLLSILKLSAGWRKSIGPGTSILIEPYAALPLTGLGYGSIRLSSFGLNFSLQLRQPYEKK